MAGGPCTRLLSRLSVFLETTSVAVDEFQPLVLASTAALQAQMAYCGALPCPDTPCSLPADDLIGINSITWLLEQCAAAVDPLDILTADALDLLAERLLTPLQIQHYLTRVLEHAYRLGEKPVTPAIVHATLAPDLHALEPALTRYGYTEEGIVNLLKITPDAFPLRKFEGV